MGEIKDISRNCKVCGQRWLPRAAAGRKIGRWVRRLAASMVMVGLLLAIWLILFLLKTRLLSYLFAMAICGAAVWGGGWLLYHLGKTARAMIVDQEVRRTNDFKNVLGLILGSVLAVLWTYFSIRAFCFWAVQW